MTTLLLYFREVVSDLDVLAAQCDVDLIVEWVRTVCMHLNAEKSKMMVMSRKRRQPKCTISVDGMPLERVSTFTYLGVTISDDLSWSRHINIVCARARRLLRFLFRNFRVAGRGCPTRLWLPLKKIVFKYPRGKKWKLPALR